MPKAEAEAPLQEDVFEDEEVVVLDTAIEAAVCTGTVVNVYLKSGNSFAISCADTEHAFFRWMEFKNAMESDAGVRKVTELSTYDEYLKEKK
jgi:hypothetical protein